MAPRDFRTRLVKRASKGGLFLPDELAAGLTAYYELLARWNQKINLTALDNPDEAIDRLLLEPVVATKQLTRPDVSIMDVGSGGGSPAIPMKLVVPASKLTMVERFHASRKPIPPSNFQSLSVVSPTELKTRPVCGP